MNFNYYCNLYHSDKGDLFLHNNNYANWYDLYFSSIREQAKYICEIGVLNGGSTKALHDYFPQANIIGLDILDKSEYNNSRIITKILDQSNSNDLDIFVKDCKEKNIEFDIILDDGSHDVADQQLTFGKFFHLLKPGGFYIIEDLCTSYFVLGQIEFWNQTQEKINNNTIKFLNQRPFYSPWIQNKDLQFLENQVEYISIYDRPNPHLSSNLRCINDYPARPITSVIKRKS